MSGVNKVILIGHLGADPEIRSFQNGGRIATFSLATGEKWTDKSGQKRERTEWHNIAVNNEALVKVAERFLRKGSKAFVEGQLRTRKWQDRDGRDRWTTEVVLAPYRGELVLLDRAEGNRAPPPDENSWGGGQSQTASGAQTASGDAGYDLDDDVPF